MKTVIAFAGFLLLFTAVTPSQEQSPQKGAIYGTVLAQDGLPAKGLTLNAEPLGVALGMALPWTRTNDVGAFRFEHLPFGRYTVYAEDKEQGYSSLSTGPARPGRPTEVTLTAERPEAEFNLRLPPRAGFLLFHLTNQRTGSVISEVEVTVMSAEKPPKPIFSGGFPSSQAVLVPSDENLLLHVKSWGFREWSKSVGDGKPIRIAPGNRLTLDVQLEPANSLTGRIPSADPKKFQGIHDGKDWKNPYLIVRADGIEIAGAASTTSPVPVESVAAALEGLPYSAWPYGLVVAVQKNDVGASEAERSRIEANQMSLEPLLGNLGVIVGLRPPAEATVQSPWEVRENGWAPIEHTGPAVEGEHQKGPGGLEGWTLSYTLPSFRYPIDRWPLTLVIARNGAVIGRIQGMPFVWRWKFLANGQEIAYEAGPPHGGLGCNLVETSTGHRLGTHDCFHTPLPNDAPEWVHDLEDAP